MTNKGGRTVACFFNGTQAVTTLEQCIGNTPLIKLQRIDPVGGGEIWLKMEGNNLAGSVKDRVALFMIQQAERRGETAPGDILIKATSGNTGIALAMIAALKGYRLKLLMPDNMSMERQAAMRAYGAELILVDQGLGRLMLRQRFCRILPLSAAPFAHLRVKQWQA